VNRSSRFQHERSNTRTITTMLFCVQPVRHTPVDSDPAQPLPVAAPCPGLRLPFFSTPRQQLRRRRRGHRDEQKQVPAMAAAPEAPSRPNLPLVRSLPSAYESGSINGEHKPQPQQQYVHMTTTQTTTQTVTVTTQVVLPLCSRTTPKRDPQLGQCPPRGTLMLNKDLPPPPADDPDIYTKQSHSLTPPVPLSATFALAHAALGLGLPSALPQPPRVSISGPPARPTIHLATDVESHKGPLARLRAGGTTNGATVEIPRQRTRFISLGVRPSPAPDVLSNESRLSVHEPAPRTSNGSFAKKVRRVRSFTDKRKGVVMSP
jgi:hypothetical protein